MGNKRTLFAEARDGEIDKLVENFTQRSPQGMQE